MPSQILVTYCATIFIASMIPGPSTFLALGQGARFGLLAGAAGGAGNVIASVIQALIAFIFILQVGHVSSQSLSALRVIGALYIIYVGFTLLQVKSFTASPNSEAPLEERSHLRHLRDGFAFAILNPKAITFFAALFPQFVHPEGWQKSAIVAVLLPIASIAYFCFMAYVIAGVALIRVFNRTQYIGAFFGSAVLLSGLVFLFRK